MRGRIRPFPDVVAVALCVGHQWQPVLLQESAWQQAGLVECWKRHAGWLLGNCHQAHFLHIATTGRVQIHHRYPIQYGKLPNVNTFHSSVETPMFTLGRSIASFAPRVTGGSEGPVVLGDVH